MTEPNAPIFTSAKPPVAFLLAVWGEQYIRQFFDLSPRSLLAPGNIPAMAEAYDCTFVFLTLRKNRKLFAAQPLFSTLERYCRVSFVDIEDLVFDGNYSATITLAYERGMRSFGQRMCDTYFIYLVSDYIMADDSLTGLMRYMAQGYSAVTAGNFQAVEETIHIPLKALVDRETGILELKPRALLAHSLKHLHPVTVANTVNQSLSHCAHSNRLFWRVDDHTMVGRFYLRHMILIKPEIDDYVIGASCDYSFVAEMCPSGKIAHITDSDEYCVIELQPLRHERHFMRFGPMPPNALAACLSEWTTAAHRTNAHVATIFHAGDIPAATAATTLQSETFIAEMEKQLTPPAPVRGHPYWISCIEAVLHHILEKEKQPLQHFRDGVFVGVLGSPTFSPALPGNGFDYLLLRMRKQYRVGWQRRLQRQFLGLLSGLPVRPRFWHPYWNDWRVIRTQAQKILKGKERAMLITRQPTWLVDELYKQCGKKIIFQQANLFLRRSQLKPCDAIIILLTDKESELLNPLLAKCREMLSAGGELVIALIKTPLSRVNLSADVAMAAPAFYGLTQVQSKFNGRFFTLFDSWLMRCAHRAARPGRLGAPKRLIALAILGILSIFYLIGNVFSMLGIKIGRPSSAVLTPRV